ncbi:MAG TPA: hypothetical protein VLV16_07040 [Gemmatimonadales bacterium]|nr:hypothetical protein [Gemmatimonadales bacterium]
MNVRTLLLGSLALVAGAACSHKPPEDYAPDPGLLAHIRDIEISITPVAACPGSWIQANYQAVIDDGTRVPFVRSYDKKHPPRLHITFLERTSAEASSNKDGNWVTNADPILTATTGFRLTATLKAKPSITHTLVVPPDYSCAPHTFAYSGATGRVSQGGQMGPDITVRLGRARSPYYEKLLMAAIEVGSQPAFYELYDARTIPPADFLQIESRGGAGGPGMAGPHGGDGTNGAGGCPAQPGGNGGAGGDGGRGGPGGQGGQITIVVPEDEPFMAGLVTARSMGGPGGPGGKGGPGGAAGKGGPPVGGSEGRQCARGADGAEGRKGSDGPVGWDGRRGPRPMIVEAPSNEVFGAGLPPELTALVRAPAAPPRPRP